MAENLEIKTENTMLQEQNIALLKEMNILKVRNDIKIHYLEDTIKFDLYFDTRSFLPTYSKLIEEKGKDIAKNPHFNLYNIKFKHFVKNWEQFHLDDLKEEDRESINEIIMQILDKID